MLNRKDTSDTEKRVKGKRRSLKGKSLDMSFIIKTGRGYWGYSNENGRSRWGGLPHLQNRKKGKEEQQKTRKPHEGKPRRDTSEKLENLTMNAREKPGSKGGMGRGNNSRVVLKETMGWTERGVWFNEHEEIPKEPIQERAQTKRQKRKGKTSEVLSRKVLKEGRKGQKKQPGETKHQFRKRVDWELKANHGEKSDKQGDEKKEPTGGESVQQT